MSVSLDIALTALQAHQRAMDVTAHNIANAGTPGYSRQRADVRSMLPQVSEVGSLGRGVRIDGIQRITDGLVNERLRAAHADVGRYDFLIGALSDIEQLFSEPGEHGLVRALDHVFSAFEELANNPELPALRFGVVEQLQGFTSTLRNLGVGLADQQEGLLAEARAQVVRANSLLDQIAQLNGQIKRETLVGRPPNDLMDQRDQRLNELTQILAVNVRTDPQSQAITVEAKGRLLVSSERALGLAFTTSGDGDLVLQIRDSGEIVQASSGRLAGLMEIGNRILPQAIDRLDELATALVREFNLVHATGVNGSATVGSHLASARIDSALLAVDLDDDRQILGSNDLSGIPAPFLPLFRDDQGGSVARNLTINVFDPATGTAEKYILRYEPGPGVVAASRTLDDIVSAINSGRGGGFSLHPPRDGGMAEVTASLISSDGGVRLQLTASGGKAIDFSRSLETRPADKAWTGAGVTVSGGDPALVEGRVVFRVVGGQLQALVEDPAGGHPTLLGSRALGSDGVLAGFAVAFAGGAADYAEGERFAVDLDVTGMVQGGAHSQARDWIAGDAGFRVSGRYTGDHAYDPARPWEIRVAQSGTVGSAGDPPAITVTWYSGPDGGRTRESSTIVLDDRHPPGSQIAIGDGVYLVFDAGQLSVGGQGVNAIIDGQPDQAGLLPALGINALLSGTSAANISVAAPIVRDPGRLTVGHTRAPGDNANLLDYGRIRDRTVMAAGTQRIDDFYVTTVAEVSLRLEQSRGFADAQQQVLRSLQNRRDSVSGVSIDEEVGLLIIQQQAYSAAARVITMTRENIQTLLDLLR